MLVAALPLIFGQFAVRAVDSEAAQRDVRRSLNREQVGISTITMATVTVARRVPTVKGII
jgi:hypothetical protein